jgi:hypothetical protein
MLWMGPKKCVWSIRCLAKFEEGLAFRTTHLPVGCGSGSVVGIATGYGLNSPGIESRWGRDFPHLLRQALGPTQPPIQWVPGLSRGKERPGLEADLSPPSSAVVKKR